MASLFHGDRKDEHVNHPSPQYGYNNQNPGYGHIHGGGPVNPGYYTASGYGHNAGGGYGHGTGHNGQPGYGAHGGEKKPGFMEKIKRKTKKNPNKVRKDGSSSSSDSD